MDKHVLPGSSPVLTILGASARAAAQSAVRAGFSPVCGDLFADEDLKQCASVARMTDYPAGLAEVCGSPQSGGWMYTGALENHPALIERMAAMRPLLGNSADVVRRVRDPVAVAAMLTRAGMTCPAVQRTTDRLPRDGSWLRKPYRSAGGARIEPWDELCSEVPDVEFYFQQRIAGRPVAAVYVANGRDAILLGATRQLIGGDSRETMYSYRGSIGPIGLADPLRDQFNRLGKILAAELQLVGLFGVDLIEDNNRKIWPLEINPRYTASVEVLERSLRINTIELHVAACRAGVLPCQIESRPRGASGKQIIFAKSELVVPGELTEYAVNANRSADWPIFADIPAAGTTIQSGWPILTVLADAGDEKELLNFLTHRRANVLLRP